MEKSEAEMNDAAITELISKKIAAGDADSGWFVALQMLRVLPVLKDIAEGLKNIDTALAPDLRGWSIGDGVRGIADVLANFAIEARYERNKRK